jgi:hypothetical protein
MRSKIVAAVLFLSVVPAHGQGANVTKSAPVVPTPPQAVPTPPPAKQPLKPTKPASPTPMTDTVIPRTGPFVYECSKAPPDGCRVECVVDGDKAVDTGGARTITMRPLAPPNNYSVEVTEQSGSLNSFFLTGTKVVCRMETVRQTREISSP